MAEHIVRDGETGQAILASTGTPVEQILGVLETSGAIESVLRAYPELSPEAVVAALRFARAAVDRGFQYVPAPATGFTGVRERALVEYGQERQATVTLEAGEYDDLLYRLDLLEGIFEAERELDEGQGVPHDEVFAQLRHKFGG